MCRKAQVMRKGGKIWGTSGGQLEDGRSEELKKTKPGRSEQERQVPRTMWGQESGRKGGTEEQVEPKII